VAICQFYDIAPRVCVCARGHLPKNRSRSGLDAIDGARRGTWCLWRQRRCVGGLVYYEHALALAAPKWDQKLEEAEAPDLFHQVKLGISSDKPVQFFDIE
ncbi:hypothetical protein GWI33_001867, partial [Rhynchophorus ferrugineus]